jgi:hypothetical protein
MTIQTRRAVALTALLASSVLSKGCLWWVAHEIHEEREERHEHAERHDNHYERHDQHDEKHERHG